MPGDILLIEEGERISADARLLEGAADMSTLTGESMPVFRTAGPGDHTTPLLMRTTSSSAGRAARAERSRRSCSRPQ